MTDPLTLVEQSIDDVSDVQLRDAEKECLEARAAYMLRQSVIEDVLISDAVLKAVHAGVNATPTQRYALDKERRYL